MFNMHVTDTEVQMTRIINLLGATFSTVDIDKLFAVAEIVGISRTEAINAMASMEKWTPERREAWSI